MEVESVAKQRPFLERFLEAPSPSGFEEGAARIWREEAGAFAERVWLDQHGNSFAVINEAGSPRVMLAGHVDEIGLMVSYIDDKGYVYVRGIGGWDTQILPGQRVWIQGSQGRVLGVLGRKPIHILEDEERKKVVKFQDLWVDIGAESKEEAQKKVAVGDPAVLAHGAEPLGERYWAARGTDDRIGAYVVLEALRKLRELKPRAAAFAVATTQEEVGLRGARTSAFGLDPQVGIAVDVTFTTDTPGTEGEKKRLGEISLGKGPVLSRGPNVNHKLLAILQETAKRENIPIQMEAAPGGTGTDANAIQLTRSGVATAIVSVPNRYMHTPCEVVARGDVDLAARLIAHTVARIDERSDFLPG